MDSRLIFLPRHQLKVTLLKVQDRPLVVLLGVLRDKEVWTARGLEKRWCRPYCKPTQVGESRRLRRSRELSLRN